MDNIEKNRVWSVRFMQSHQPENMPYSGMIVEEIESAGYAMPRQIPHEIPVEVGGQITLTLSGRGVFRAGGKKYDCVPGSAFLYRDSDPLVSYACPEEGPGKWRFLWVNFMGKASNSLIEEVNRIYGYFFFPGKNSELERTLLAYKQMAGTTFTQTPLEAAKMVFDLLNLLCVRTASAGGTLPPRQSRTEEVRMEISRAFDESVTTSTLAKKLGISREHLSRTFRQETGRTLQEYRESARLKEALELLVKSNRSCKEIALRCHFGSYSSFFRVFRKHFGCSPEEFRKKQG